MTNPQDHGSKKKKAGDNGDTNKDGESEGFPLVVYQASVMVGAGAGILALAVYGSLSPDADGWQIAALSFLIGVAAFMVSGLFGYLFGIPVATAESSVWWSFAVSFRGWTVSAMRLRRPPTSRRPSKRSSP